MNNDGTVKEELGGLGNRISGTAKDAAGSVTGDRSLEREGEAQANFGNARQENNDVLGSNTSGSTGRSGMLTGMFKDRESAESAYNSAISRGYSKDDVNLMMSDQTRDSWYSGADADDSGLGSKALEGAGAGSAIGGTLGAIIGGIAAIGTSVLLPGVGLIIAGPLAAALAGAGAGGLTGGLVGALVGSGIPEDRAREYEEGVKNGGVVMGVNPRSNEDADYFENEWRNNRGENIYR
ncbi:MAG TPA: CsbD family protein [Pyrinomonadaceae bacterium]|nr:CsbD family protein [Pyrinomonadaceae bacterium]